MTGEALLDVDQLRVEIPTPGGSLRAVREMSFVLAPGETLAIVGESGCGKSLTSLAIMDLLPNKARRYACKLEFKGQNLLGLGYDEMADLRGSQIAMIFQDPMTALNPAYSVGNQLEEVYLRHRGGSRASARERAVHLLERVGVPAPDRRLRQYPHQLSGGLRQRVMIAMALMCEPELLIADEPTTALDVTIQAQILRLLADLQREFGMGLILVSHDLGVVARVADRIIVMYGGQIVEAASAEALFAEPLHPYSEGLMRSIPAPGKTPRGEELGTIPGVVAPQYGELHECVFAHRCPYVGEACRNGAIPLRDAGERHLFRCVLPGDGSQRDSEAWVKAAEGLLG